MSEEIFRPRKPEDLSTENLNIKGPIPKEFLEALQNVKKERAEVQEVPKNVPNINSSGQLKETLEAIKGYQFNYDEVQLPSKGKFYDGSNGPLNGILSIKPMTTAEEEILATPGLMKKGVGLNMIFKNCMKESYRPEKFLLIDWVFLLIYLRGISYSPKYDVEVKCRECDTRFSTSIDLNGCDVEYCPDNFGPILQDILPTTKLPFTYHLATRSDQQEIESYREGKIKVYGDSAIDDTLIHRTTMLLDNINGITNKMELKVLLKNLPINDGSYIRNAINDPPFGVNTNIEISCPNCLQDFEVDLPLEAGFFFPKRRKVMT